MLKGEHNLSTFKLMEIYNKRLLIVNDNININIITVWSWIEVTYLIFKINYLQNKSLIFTSSSLIF